MNGNVALIFDELGQFYDKRFFMSPNETHSFVSGFKLCLGLTLMGFKYRIYALPRDAEMMACVENHIAISEAEKKVRE